MRIPKCLCSLLLWTALAATGTSGHNVTDHDTDGGGCNLTTVFEAQKDPLDPGTEGLSLLVALTMANREGEALLSPGFFHLAAALMAVEHFNQRKATIVPELAQSWLQNCPIRIDPEGMEIMDTGSDRMQAMKTVLERRQLPHAIVGPYDELPAMELSVVASTLRIPMVTHRGLDHNLLLPFKHPFVTQVNADLYSDMEFLGDYLVHSGRTDYIAVLYASNADTSMERVEAFKGGAQAKNIQNVLSFGYVSSMSLDAANHPTQNISSAMEKVKASGFRTIVLITPWMDNELTFIGNEAHKQGLDRGDHFWVIASTFEIGRRVQPQDHESDAWGVNAEQYKEAIRLGISNITQMMHDYFDSYDTLDFIKNAAFLTQAELVNVRDPNHSTFMSEWTKLDESFIQRLVDLNPIASSRYSGEWSENMFMGSMMGWTTMEQYPMGEFPPNELFSKPIPFLSSPPYGSIHLYDAIMAVGIGACKAAKDLLEQRRLNQPPPPPSSGEFNSTTWTGERFQDAIRSSRFTGASGEIHFGGGFPGSRSGETITYHVVNVMPNGLLDDPYAVAEIRNATDGKWYQVRPFHYANGGTSPPFLLRDPADQNYLGKGIRATGLALMSVALLAIALSVAWVATYRHNSIVVASQPIFLYVMCLGSTMTTLAILFRSFDESYGWSTEQLTTACIITPWLVVLGHIWTYGSLFTKLWRVNRVLQFSRRKVNMIHVLWPNWAIEIVAVILLSIWTAKSDYHWERNEIDVATGESMGRCTGDEFAVMWIPIMLLLMVPTILTGVMAWKTIDVAAVYSEAKWIFALILVQCQVIFVGLPMVFILDDVSTDGRFLGATLILWTFPMTTIGLIMVPKMVAVHYPPNGDSREKRGSSPRVRVSGMTSCPGDNGTLTHPSASQQSNGSGSLGNRQSDTNAPTFTESALRQSKPRHSVVTQL